MLGFYCCVKLITVNLSGSTIITDFHVLLEVIDASLARVHLFLKYTFGSLTRLYILILLHEVVICLPVVLFFQIIVSV